jgi:hypothetical protein
MACIRIACDGAATAAFGISRMPASYRDLEAARFRSDRDKRSNKRLEDRTAGAEMRKQVSIKSSSFPEGGDEETKSSQSIQTSKW